MLFLLAFIKSILSSFTRSRVFRHETHLPVALSITCDSMRNITIDTIDLVAKDLPRGIGRDGLDRRLRLVVAHQKLRVGLWVVQFSVTQQV